MAKICCGGFYLGEGLELNGRTLKATGGSGLPDPSELPDGTAMVAVNGEWKMQEGYGYSVEGEEVTLLPEMNVTTEFDSEWGGNIGVIGDPFAPVSETPVADKEYTVIFNGTPYVITSFADEFGGIALGEISPETFMPIFTNFPFFIMFEIGDNITGNIETENAGTYSLSIAHQWDTIHQFDSSLIPSSGVEEFVVNFDISSGEVVADKTVEEVNAAIFSGKPVRGYVYDTLFFAEALYGISCFYYLDADALRNGSLNVYIVLAGNDGWELEHKQFALTDI